MSGSVQVFGRRNAETIHALGWPASENLHNCGRSGSSCAREDFIRSYGLAAGHSGHDR
jgi:hypothetical protein